MAEAPYSECGSWEFDSPRQHVKIPTMLKTPAAVFAGIGITSLTAAVLMACTVPSGASADPNIYQHNVQLDDGRVIVCIVFDNTSYEGDMLTCDWK